LNDPVSSAFANLLRREPAAVGLFKSQASSALARLSLPAAECDRIVALALDRTLENEAEFRSVEASARRHALALAAAEVIEREFEALTRTGAAAPQDRLLYSQIVTLPPHARTLVVRVFVKREEFAEVIQQLNLPGLALSAEITSIRKIVNPQAGAPPAGDVPAYVRVPFLVTGHIPPEDALRVREYLGQSEACRAAYRDLDLFERQAARLGPAAGSLHADVEELINIADGSEIRSERRDALAEHLRLCCGCEAVLRELKSTAVRGGAASLMQQFDTPGRRRQIALVAVALALIVPLAWYELTATRTPILEFGGVQGLDLGEPLALDPSRPPVVVSLQPATGGAPFTPPFMIRVPIEKDVAFDLRVEDATGGIVVSAGDVRIHREEGEPKGIIAFSFRGSRLSAGDYRIHLLRRIRGAGGDPADWIYPIRLVD
jgi:hypothetical protein